MSEYWRSELGFTQKEMAEHPGNPYKIRRVELVQREIECFEVLNPDGTRYDIYDREGAEWWAAHLYWEYLQSDRRAAQMLTGQEA